MSLLSIFSKKEATPEEKAESQPDETTAEETPAEEAPAEEATAEEAPAEEAPAEEAPAEETPAEEAPAEEATAEEAPAEEAPAEEPPAEEATAEETPAQEKPPKDYFLLFINFLKTNKFVHEIFTFLCIVAVCFCAVLTYGEVEKKKGLPSFETFYEEGQAKKVVSCFLKQDMTKLLDYCYVETSSKQENTTLIQMKKKIASKLKAEYKQLFTHFDMELKSVACEYSTDEQGEPILVSTCHIALTNDMELLFVLYKKNSKQYSMKIATADGKDEIHFHDMNAWFHYYETAFSSPTDERISTYLETGGRDKLQKALHYFTKDSSKESKKNYCVKLTEQFTKLEDMNVHVEQAYIDNYHFNEKTTQKSSTLLLYFKDDFFDSEFIVYQPLIIGLYGYQPNGSPIIYGNDIRSEVYNHCATLMNLG